MFEYEWLSAQWFEKFIYPVANKLILALLILALGLWIAGRLKKIVFRVISRSRLDPLLVKFISDIVYWILLIAVFLAALDQVGFNITSLIAIFGAAGLAVALAMKDSLSNFAAGIMLIMFRPFTIDDFVEAGGVIGQVKHTGFFLTTLLTPDNKRVSVPNSSIFGQTIINFSAMENRRVDIVVGISYHDDIQKAKDIIKELFNSDQRILTDPEPVVRVGLLGESSIDLTVLPWVAKENYWNVHSDLQQAIKERFDAEGITIPFPQRDLHITDKKITS